jgi:shikimate dehydrogenase/3-dehydroquinate dehydratase type I
MAHLCVALSETTTEAMLAAMRAVPDGVDIVELRLDAIADLNAAQVRRLCAAKDRPIIATNRAEREGGLRAQPEDERLEALRVAATCGVEYVDVEFDASAELGALPGTTARIVSHHDFDGTPGDLDAWVDRLRDAGADIAKLAVTARSFADTPAVLRLLQRRARQAPLIALAMGESGVATRILAGKFGGFLTFASAGAGHETAPGQVGVQQMLGMYRFAEIDANTEVYGVAANPVAHSLSPAIHNAAFAATQRNAVYLPLKVDDCAALLDDMAPLGLRGLSVTIPHKATMCALMDEVDELSARVGVINTVRLTDGRRSGCNTDVAAAVGGIASAAARAGIADLSGRSVLLVGAGGAGRAIAWGLHAEGAVLTIANRTASRAVALADELGVASCPLEDIAGLNPDILVNATSRGMWPHVDDSPVPRALLRCGMVVFDSVYNPARTRLLREAEDAGCITASGLEWFAAQAAAQFEYWTGQPAPTEVMRAVIEEAAS